MGAHNLAFKLHEARLADIQSVKDPGDGGTIVVSPQDLTVCVVEGGTTRSLQAAATVPLGVKVRVISQTSSITVNGTSLADGESAEFVVILNSSGARTWAVTPTASSLAALGSADFSTAPVNLGTVEINTGNGGSDDAIVALFNALKAFGLVSGTWTAAA